MPMLVVNNVLLPSTKMSNLHKLDNVYVVVPTTGLVEMKVSFDVLVFMVAVTTSL
jgi:hypothetical protein